MKKPFAVLSTMAIAASVVTPGIAASAATPAEQAPEGFYNIATNKYISVNEFDALSTDAKKELIKNKDVYYVTDGNVIKALDVLITKTDDLSSKITSQSDFEEANDIDLNKIASSSGEIKVQSVSAINPTTVEVTFNQEVEALAKADVTVTNNETNVKQLVKSVELAKDGKSATVSFYDALKSGTTYTVAVKDAGSVDLAYAVGVPTTIVAETTQVFAAPGNTEKVAYKVLDENGLDITSSTNDVEFQSTSRDINSTTGVVNATNLAGKSAFVYVVVTKEDGTELKSERITVKAEEAKAAVIKDYTVGDSANFTAADYKQNTKVSVTDDTKKLFVQAENQFGKDFPTAGKVSFESLDLDVAVVDAASGQITPIKEGKFAVKITVGNVSKTVELEVVAESKATTVELDKSEVTLSNKATTPATVKVSVKDQNGIKMPGVATTATATTTAGKALINVSGVKDGEFTITPKENVKAGTATVEVKVNDTVKTTLVVTITEAGEVDAYELKGFKAELDKNADEENTNDTATLSVIPVDANGVQSGAAVDNASFVVTDKDGEEVDGAVSEEGVINAATFTTGETYTLTVKVGSVTVATKTFKVVDTTPQPELEFTATTVKDANLNGNLLDDIAGKLSATLGEKTYTVASEANPLTVSSIKFISTDSTVVESATAADTIRVLKPGTTNLLIGEVAVKIGGKSYTIDMKNFKLVADVTSAQTAPANSEKTITVEGLTNDNLRFLVAGKGTPQEVTTLEDVKTYLTENYDGAVLDTTKINVDDATGELTVEDGLLTAANWNKVKATENANNSAPYRITVLKTDKQNKVAKIAMYADGTVAIEAITPAP